MIERSFRICESEYAQLKEIADVEHLPISKLIRDAITNLLEEYKDSVSCVNVSNRS